MEKGAAIVRISAQGSAPIVSSESSRITKTANTYEWLSGMLVKRSSLDFRAPEKHLDTRTNDLVMLECEHEDCEEMSADVLD
jgi:hypothetical protein